MWCRYIDATNTLIHFPSLSWTTDVRWHTHTTIGWDAILRRLNGINRQTQLGIYGKSMLQFEFYCRFLTKTFIHTTHTVVLLFECHRHHYASTATAVHLMSYAIVYNSLCFAYNNFVSFFLVFLLWTGEILLLAQFERKETIKERSKWG